MMNILVNKSQINKLKFILSENISTEFDVSQDRVNSFEKLFNRYMRKELDWWKELNLKSIKLIPMGSFGYNMHMVGDLIIDADWAYESAKNVGRNLNNLLDPESNDEPSEDDKITLGDIITERQGNELRKVITPFASTFFTKNISHASFGAITTSI